MTLSSGVAGASSDGGSMVVSTGARSATSFNVLFSFVVKVSLRRLFCDRGCKFGLATAAGDSSIVDMRLLSNLAGDLRTGGLGPVVGAGCAGSSCGFLHSDSVGLLANWRMGVTFHSSSSVASSSSMGFAFFLEAANVSVSNPAL